jgi:monoamine oxidase
MSRSPSFGSFARAIRIARYCEANNISTSEGLEQAATLEARAAGRRLSRREFLANMGKLAVVGGIGPVAWPLRNVLAAPAPGPAVKVAIVGAGLAGLTCGDELNTNGIKADLYDANNRVGGRCFSLSDFFPGQVAERGGEFIDNLHKTMLGYAKRFNLALEDVEKAPGEVFYFFDGQHFPESAVVDEFRELVAAMRDDLRTVGQPTADRHTEADAILDFTNLRDYLQTRGAGTIARKAIEEAYINEYGLEIDQQSCLNFLLFIHADRRSKFRPFGVFSDERYHIIGGNEQIVEGLRDRLNGQIQLGMRLVKAKKNTSGLRHTSHRPARPNGSRLLR